MAADEPAQNPRLRNPDPDELQQALNRLQKRYEHFSYEDRHLRMIEDIKQMEVSESDRRELLRRLG